MINILAKSMQIATRTEAAAAQRNLPNHSDARHPNPWLPAGHWWLNHDKKRGDDRG